MRYRIEVVEGDLFVRNVETDVKFGSVIPHWIDNQHSPNFPKLYGCTVLNREWDEIATITVSNPFQNGMFALAGHEAYYGYPCLKECAKDTDTHRIEWRLATLLADAASEIARGLIEHRSGGLKAETKWKCAELLAQLQGIWYASRFGSFDAERQVHDPYFARCSSPRMSFAEAAQHYGMFRLQMQFPDESEETLKMVLSWPLDLLRDTLNRLLPHRLSH